MLILLLPAPLRAVLADPLYRWEARRYWTRRRYALVSGALLAWWAMLLVSAWQAAIYMTASDRQLLTLLVLFAALARLPLLVVSAMGAALSIAPDKASRRLEQFVLSPMAPWRFCMARVAGRLKGIFVLWVCMGGLLFLVAVAGWAVWAPPDSPGWLAVALVAVAALQVDSAGTILGDAALAAHFSAKAGNGAVAVAETFVAAFILIPLVFAGMLAFAVYGGILGLAGQGAPLVLWVLVLALLRLAVLSIALRAYPDDARQSVEKLFLQPED